MRMKLCAVLVVISTLLIMVTAGLAEAANGTLTFYLKTKDPTTGVESPVLRAFLYLHDATKPPPMEKYFSAADYILWGAYSGGLYRISVPEGRWFMRMTQRADPAKQSTYWSKGPPQAGDLTWMQTAPVTIVAGQTLNLGTLYAYPFGSAPITITGTVRSSSGAPLAGRYVRAQTVPCISDGFDNNINQCGPVKDLALNPTDANGKYTLVLRDPGTYYLYTSPCLTNKFYSYVGNACVYTPAPNNPIVVKIRDNIVVNMVGN
jgi:hypothetical protein